MKKKKHVAWILKIKMTQACRPQSCRLTRTRIFSFLNKFWLKTNFFLKSFFYIFLCSSSLVVLLYFGRWSLIKRMSIQIQIQFRSDNDIIWTYIFVRVIPLKRMLNLKKNRMFTLVLILFSYWMLILQFVWV
jgi:hypothetical protein